VSRRRRDSSPDTGRGAVDGGAHLLAGIRRAVARRRLFPRGARILVGCSGGPDSVALTHGLHRLRDELGLDLVVASIDHGLRPEAPDDVAVAARLAEDLGLPFRTRALSLDVRAGSSPMAAAREARYQALAGLAAETGAGFVAVGHTLDDQAETVLARLLRGATLEGLAGIAPRRRDGVVRPLIDVRRRDVLGYLRHHELAFADDPTNRSPRYERVRIRHRWLPALTDAEDPRLPEHLAALADQARELRRRQRRAGRRLLERGSRPGGELGVARLRAAPSPVRRHALTAWLVGGGSASAPPGSRVLDALESLLETGRGEVRVPGEQTVVISGGALVVLPTDASLVSRSGPGRGR